MSHHQPPEEGGPRPPQPYAAPPQGGPYAPPPQGGPYAPPPPSGPYAPPPQAGPYAPPPQGGPYAPPAQHRPYPPHAGQPYGAPPQPAPPPPYGRQPSGPPEQTATETAPKRRRTSPRRRRTTELIALAVLLPLLLGLHWYDDRIAVRNGIKRPEVVTVVARGKTATLDRVQWTMLGRDMRPSSSTSTPASGTAELKLLVTARPLDAQAAKDLGRARVVFRVTDRDGHIWSASARMPEDITAGGAISVPVTATVPPGLLRSVVLEIAQTRNSVPKGPLAVLRFAH